MPLNVSGLSVATGVPDFPTAVSYDDDSSSSPSVSVSTCHEDERRRIAPESESLAVQSTQTAESARSLSTLTAISFRSHASEAPNPELEAAELQLQLLLQQRTNLMAQLQNIRLNFNGNFRLLGILWAPMAVMKTLSFFYWVYFVTRFATNTDMSVFVCALGSFSLLVLSFALSCDKYFLYIPFAVTMTVEGISAMQQAYILHTLAKEAGNGADIDMLVDLLLMRRDIFSLGIIEHVIMDNDFIRVMLYYHVKAVFFPLILTLTVFICLLVRRKGLAVEILRKQAEFLHIRTYEVMRTMEFLRNRPNPSPPNQPQIHRVLPPMIALNNAAPFIYNPMH